MSGSSFRVIAGLDPAIHTTLPLRGTRVMDARVKPGHDNECLLAFRRPLPRLTEFTTDLDPGLDTLRRRGGRAGGAS
jgi:hypothetical protein